MQRQDCQAGGGGGEGEGRGRGGGGEGEGEGRLQRHLEPATHSEQGREQLHYPP